jgi:hypothetical protein
MRRRLEEMLILRRSSKRMLEDRRLRLSEINRELSVIAESQAFIQGVAESVQSCLSSKIDGIVNLGLTSCFPGYEFRMEYAPCRGKTEARFVVTNGGKEIDPMNQCGGGLVDMLCFCLRMAVYSISSVNNVIILDEPFRYISRSLRPRVAELLSVLSEKLGIQILEVTHMDEFSDNASNKVLIKKTNGISEVIGNE